MIDKKEIGVRIAGLRLEAGLSRERLEEILELGDNTLYRYENGIRSMPLEVLDKYCCFFKVSADFILYGDTQEEERKKAIKQAMEILGSAV